VNGDHSLPPSPSLELSLGDLERSPERSKAPATTAVQSSRRAKNAAHRANDVEFAFEIGSGLLTEVRRLQSLLTERDEAIESLQADLRAVKVRHNADLRAVKARHNTEIAQARRQTVSLQRDKSDLQQTLNSSRVEWSKASERLPCFDSPLTSNGGSVSEMAAHLEADAFTDNGRRLGAPGTFPDGNDRPANSSLKPSPPRPFLVPNHATIEIEVLQRSLAHAEKQITTLKDTLQREKNLCTEYRCKLESLPGAMIEEDKVEGNSRNTTSRALLAWFSGGTKIPFM